MAIRKRYSTMESQMRVSSYARYRDKKGRFAASEKSSNSQEELQSSSDKKVVWENEKDNSRILVRKEKEHTDVTLAVYLASIILILILK